MKFPQGVHCSIQSFGVPGKMYYIRGHGMLYTELETLRLSGVSSMLIANSREECSRIHIIVTLLICSNIASSPSTRDFSSEVRCRLCYWLGVWILEGSEESHKKLQDESKEGVS